MSMLQGSSSLRRYLTACDGSSAFTYAGSGLFTATPGIAHPIVPVGRGLTATLIPFGDLSTGASADNATFDYRVFMIFPMQRGAWDAVDKATARVGESAPDLVRVYLGGGTVTLGSLTGAAGGVLAATEHFGDTITWTPSGVATAVVGPAVVGETSFNEGTSAAYDADTPDNTFGMLFLPCLLRGSGLLIDFNRTTANARGNFLVRVNEI